jgi:hypothetical protein
MKFKTLLFIAIIALSATHNILASDTIKIVGEEFVPYKYVEGKESASPTRANGHNTLI